MKDCKDEKERYFNNVFISFIIAFFFPFIGLILSLVWFENKPKCAKACLKGIVCAIITIVIVMRFIFPNISFI